MSRLAARAALTATLWLTVFVGAARAEVAGDAGARRDDDAGVIEPASDLRREGAWPSDERVTMKVEGMPRVEAIRKLADEVGWSVIVRGVSNEPVDVRVVKQPAARVLELILAGEPFVARREDGMIAIAPAADVAPIGARRSLPRSSDAPVPPPPPAPPAPPKPPRHGGDKLVTAGNATIGPDEVVGNLTVLAGDVDVYGTVEEDLAVFAGHVHLRDGAHVRGDISAVAGQVDIDEGARVDGAVSGVVGHVKRGGRSDAEDEQDEEEDEEASEHEREARDAEREARRAERELAREARAAARKARRGSGDWPDRDDEVDDDEAAPSDGTLARIERAGNAVARSALLFAFGAVLLALAGRRVQRLQAEVAARPVHALVVGGVSLFLGFLALLVTTVTIVGIPLALAALLVGTVSVYVGICAALTALGRAILHTRTPSAYLHLALGCALYLVASSLPGIGWVVTGAVVMIGFGALVRTRAAGLLSRSIPPAPPAPPAAPITPQLGHEP